MNNPHYKNLVKLITKQGQRHGIWEVFTDFLEMAAISLSNAVDHSPEREKRENQYLQTVKRYSKSEVQVFPEILGELILAMEEEPGDILGRVFGELGLGNKWAGQFFTPDPVAKIMAKILLTEDIKREIDEKGFVTVQEPTIGSGTMIINMSLAMHEEEINPQQSMVVTGLDIDIKCIYMAYIQLTLLHIPAILVHGNSLSMEVHSKWFTPAYILGGWAFRRQTQKIDNIIEMPKPKEPQETITRKPTKYEVMSLFA